MNPALWSLILQIETTMLTLTFALNLQPDPTGEAPLTLIAGQHGTHCEPTWATAPQ